MFKTTLLLLWAAIAVPVCFAQNQGGGITQPGAAQISAVNPLSPPLPCTASSPLLLYTSGGTQAPYTCGPSGVYIAAPGGSTSTLAASGIGAAGAAGSNKLVGPANVLVKLDGSGNGASAVPGGATFGSGDYLSTSQAGVQAIASPFTSPTISNVIQVDGQPTSCSDGLGHTLTTKTQCAVVAALALMDTLQSDIKIKYGSAGTYDTCGSIYLSDSVGRYAISLEGEGRSWQNGQKSATHIRAICASRFVGDPVVPTVYKPIGTTSFVWPVVNIKGLEIDPNGFMPAAMELYGAVPHTEDNLFDPGISGNDHVVKVGDFPSTNFGGAYEWISINDKISGPYTGSGARFTPVIGTGASANNIVSYTLVSGGAGYSCATNAATVRLVTYGAGTLPTTLPITTCSGGQITALTPAAGTIAGQGQNLTGTVDVQILDIYPSTYGLVNNATASNIYGMILKDIGQTYSLIDNSGHNQYHHVHPQGVLGGLALMGGGIFAEFTECDTVAQCFLISGAHNRLIGTEDYFSAGVAASLPGSSTFFLAPGYGGFTTISGTRSGADTAGADFHEYTNTAGALNPTQVPINVGVSIGDQGDTSTGGTMGGFFNGPTYFTSSKWLAASASTTSGVNANSTTSQWCAAAGTGSGTQFPCVQFQNVISGTGAAVTQFAKFTFNNPGSGHQIYQFGGGNAQIDATTNVATFTGGVTGGSHTGTGTATFAPQAGAGSGATAVCATSHLCDSFSGEVTLTSGAVPAIGSDLIITLPITRTNLPNCAVEVKGGTLFLGDTKTVTTSTITISTGAALAAATAYTINYVCGGN